MNLPFFHHCFHYLLRFLVNFVCLALLASGAVAVKAAQPAVASFITTEQRAEDFAHFCRFLDQNYAYFDVKRTDWPQTCKFYAPLAASAPNKVAFIGVLERALGELYDHHAHLGSNTQQSFRLVPSASQLFAAWVDGKAIITDVRRGSNAEAAGLRAGTELRAVNGEPVHSLVTQLEPRFLSRADPAAQHWALQLLLTGQHDRPTTTLQVWAAGKLSDVSFDPSSAEPSALLSFSLLGNIGHIRVHNSLGQLALVQQFDAALLALADADALVIDLRDTPSGGNTTVARGILGRFVTQPRAYQRHELVAEFKSTGIRRSWAETVSPRGTPYLKPVVVLVGRWTGSMGEGLAIGLNAARGAAVVGTRMAQLLGAIGETELPHSKIAVRVPTEKLFHVDGTPRDAFAPCALRRASSPQRMPKVPAAADDPELAAAVALASALQSRPQAVAPTRGLAASSLAALSKRAALCEALNYY